jgi:hypothetical protein
MASPFAEAITQSMIAGLDPMNGVIRQYAQQTIATQDLSLKDQKLELIEKIEQRLHAATERKAPPSVLSTYEKMLSDLTA